MRRSNRFALIAMLAALSTAAAAVAPARAAEWVADPGHSSAEFAVKHLVITTVKGTIPILSATVQTAGDSLLPTSIAADLDPKGIDSKNPDRDADLRGKDWLDVATYPAMTYASTSIVGAGPNAFTVSGNLTLHGVTKPVVLTGTIDGSVADGRGRRRVAYTATGTIDRRDFGLDYLRATPGGDAIAGFAVTITIELEAIAKAP